MIFLMRKIVPATTVRTFPPACFQNSLTKNEPMTTKTRLFTILIGLATAGSLSAATLPSVTSGTAFLHLDGSGIDATGGPGGTLRWTDNISGVNFDLSGPLGTSPTQESVTVNGFARQAVRFPGGDSALTSTTNLQLFPTSSSGLTAFVLFDVDSNAGQKFVFNQGVSAPFPGNNFEIGIDTGVGAGDGNFGLHKGHGNATIAPAGTILSDTFTLTTITVLPAGNSPANVTIHQDGTALSLANDNQGYLNAGSYATDFRPIDIGGRNDGATGNFNSLHDGDIVEVVIYQGALTDADRMAVEAALLVPEPSAFVLAALGLLPLGLRRRRN